ncbi:NADPH-dependent 7-cyano-7-deazaguanine reductase QueF [Polynucleobacter sp. AP-Sving-400A-A2]|uniref:NADPH-dependent 7-cyano-7-deazaguanine reductase QueF n=1 Tax=Polynucleobacter sp. AP-Sving-400A-A2 TaxID=2081049 RepID=UPI001BFD26C5|nr:NADPH-dependent 7-cyano-7-deazaguanine reductase QueF [Polynucleobacter sp. AP-Sving-400A-A2]QWE14431.1 NADPH-dependent 7-cyano-7-deazaguanine reductase QueF [Polynucleobacter sp. AP-Sving-400A-A2]
MSILTLGQATPYPDQYDPSLLFPIPRSENRLKLDIKANQALPFVGVDIWNAFELSWLNKKGKPQIALAEFQVPADTPNMVESKSFKLYLNSFNSARFEDEAAVRERLIADLSAVAGGKIATRINPTEAVAKKGMQEMSGVLMDRLDIEIDPSLSADPALLEVNESFGPIEQCLVSHLLKSNCPVTGQPDWASVQIRYQGRPILEEGLLRYLIGFRQLGEFHEHCVETIFTDIKRQCKPEKLSVYARYTRRGGLDINPFRTDHNSPWPENLRHARQ